MEKRTNVHTGVTTPPPSVFTPLPTASYRLSSLFITVVVAVFVSLLFLFLPSESSKEKWTLDGLLKLCNVKAKQMCFCYLCL